MGRFDKDKEAILKCAHWLSEQGYFGCARGSGGNISVKLTDANMIAITPSMRSYREMSMEDICVINEKLETIEGRLPPSLEAALHLAVYQNRPGVRALIHTHSVFASILSVIHAPIPALFDEIVLEIGASVDLVPYAVSGSSQLAANVIGKLGNNCFCYLLQNHGALSLGETIDQALKNAELVEKAAQVYYHALISGRNITTLTRDALDQINQMRRSQ